MKIEVQGQILSAESKPYNVQGNTGTSHKVRVLVEGEIYDCKSSPEQVAEMVPNIGSMGKVNFDLKSRKEVLTISIVSFSKAGK